MPLDGSAWTESSPTNSDLVSEGDDNFRDVKIAVRSRMVTEHVWPASQTGTNEGGWHSFVTLKSQASAPSLVYGTSTQQGAVYVDSASRAFMFKDSAGTAIAVMAGATQTGVGLVPTGVMLPFAATAAPQGYLMCTGGAVSRTTYVRLFGAIGTIWGTGDNSTTFNVPDMRGRTPVGVGGTAFTALGVTTGTEGVVLTVANLAAHTHTIDGRASRGTNAGTETYAGSQLAGGGATISVSSTGGDTAHTNIQPSAVVGFIIKD